MGDKMRWRYGDTNPVIAAVDPATVIEIGDLVWQHTEDAKPASECRLQLQDPLSEQSGAEQVAENFAALFLGVAMQRSREGDDRPIRVATTGVFEFDCPSRTFELGDLVGPCLVGFDGGKLENQGVVQVTEPKYAIARVAKFEHDPTRTVLVDIRSTVMIGGVAGTTTASL